MKSMALLTLLALSFLAAFHLPSEAVMGDNKPALSLKVHPTFGTGGAIRKLDAVIPGEKLFFALKCDGVSLSKSGDCRYSLKYELVSSNGDIVESEECGEILQQLIFRRSYLKRTARTHLNLGLKRSIDPGKYTLKFTVSQGDVTSTDTVELTIVPPNQFAIGFFELSTDFGKEGRMKGNCYNVGNVGSVHFVVQGLQSVSGRVSAEVSLRVVDRKGNPVCIDDFKRGIETNSPLSDTIPLYIGIVLPEPSEFLFQLNVRDLTTNKTLTETIPIVVVDSWSEE